MREKKRAQELRVDEISKQKLRESHETIQRLTSKVQELQERMNHLNDSGEFQEEGSNYSGTFSHVPSQPAGIPSPRSMLSCDNRLALDTWNLSGSQENVCGNPHSMFKSAQTLYQGILHSTTPSATGAVPVHVCTEALVARGEDQIGSTIPMPTFAGRLSTMSSFLPVDMPQNAKVGQQRQQISELQFDKFTTPSTFSCWKSRFKTQVSACSGCASKKWIWTTWNHRAQFKVIFILRISRYWMRELLSLNIIQNSHLKKRVSLEEQKAQKEDRVQGRQIAYMILRLRSCHWCSWYRFWSCGFILYHSLLTTTVFRTSIRDGMNILSSMTKVPSDDILESLYKSRIRESDQLKNCFRIVRRGNPSEDIDARLSKTENDVEEKHRSETQFVKFGRQKWENLKQRQWSWGERD